MTIDATKILSLDEINAVLVRQRRGSAHGEREPLLRLVIVRLSCCVGLRASGIANLQCGDVHTGIERPYVQIRHGKGDKNRRVPLWWDAGTLADLQTWRWIRSQEGAANSDPYCCTVRRVKLCRQGVWRRFKTACRQALGPEREATVTVHHGRHSFVSHALAAGRSLAEVQAAAGHADTGTTSVYTHIAVQDDGTLGHIFESQHGEETTAAKPYDPTPPTTEGRLPRIFGLR